METSHSLEEKMKCRGVRPSPIRLLVLRTLSDAASPMSVQELETVLGTVDRSSISRAVEIFRQARLVHSIQDGSSSLKYEVCKGEHSSLHSDEHLHFHCEQCGNTICLTDIPVPLFSLPDGFVANKSNFVIVGLCDKCSKKIL